MKTKKCKYCQIELGGAYETKAPHRVHEPRRCRDILVERVKEQDAFIESVAHFADCTGATVKDVQRMGMLHVGIDMGKPGGDETAVTTLERNDQGGFDVIKTEV